MLALTCFKLNSGLSLVIWVTDGIKMRFRYFNLCWIWQQKQSKDWMIFCETRQMLEEISPLFPWGDAIINHVSGGQQILNIKRNWGLCQSKDGEEECPRCCVHRLENLIKYWALCKIFVSAGAKLLYILRALALTLRIILHKMTVVNNDAVRPVYRYSTKWNEQLTIFCRKNRSTLSMY